MSKQEIVTITLRFPVSLRDWVKSQAESERRSSHNFILRLIELAKESKK
jgi:hypothetical protein